MPVLQIEHSVRDYEMWKAAFDSDPVGRTEGDVRGYRVARPVDDPAYVLLELEFDSEPAANAFLEKLRVMWGEAGPRLGFDMPETRLVDVVESVTL